MLIVVETGTGPELETRTGGESAAEPSRRSALGPNEFELRTWKSKRELSVKEITI